MLFTLSLINKIRFTQTLNRNWTLFVISLGKTLLIVYTVIDIKMSSFFFFLLPFCLIKVFTMGGRGGGINSVFLIELKNTF